MTGPREMDTADETPSEKSGTSSEIEALRLGLEDAKRTHNEALVAFSEVSEKAWRIVQLNGIVATIFASAVVSSPDSLSFTLIPILSLFIGFILIGLSTWEATAGQEATKLNLGQSSDALASLRDHRPAESKYIEETLKSYESWIDECIQKTEKNGRIVNRAKSESLGGIALITLGLLAGLVI